MDQVETALLAGKAAIDAADPNWTGEYAFEGKDLAEGAVIFMNKLRSVI